MIGRQLHRHDWRDTGLWLDSWTTRKQCHTCGAIYDPPLPKHSAAAAAKQRQDNAVVAAAHYERLMREFERSKGAAS